MNTKGTSVPEARRPSLQRRVAAIAVLCVCATACRTPPAPVSTIADVDTMSWTPDASILTLGTGDVVRVTLRGHDDLSSPPEGSALDEAGNVTLPLVGALAFEGLSIEGANEVARAAYAVYVQEPQVAVSIVRRESKRFHVLGHVSEPGPRAMTMPLTALDALAQGGVFLNAADREEVFLVRPHGEDLEVHTFNAATPDRMGLVQIRPGDLVFVRRKGTQRFQEEILPLLAPLYTVAPTALALDAIH